jgi:hypothetical protein
VVALVGFVAGEEAGTEDKITTTQVPILRNINTQNGDGSYTYGFESADGTYKIETRFVNGEIKGKYGYYDNDGVLREATYGGSVDGGFDDTRVASATIIDNIVPVEKRKARPGSRFAHFKARKFKSEENTEIAEGSADEEEAALAAPIPKEEPAPVAIKAVQEIKEVKPRKQSNPPRRQDKPRKQSNPPRRQDKPRKQSNTKSRFANFKPRNGGSQASASTIGHTSTIKIRVDKSGPFNGRLVDDDVKVVNGRRAVLKKRLRFRAKPAPAAPAPVAPAPPAPKPAPIKPKLTPQQNKISNEQALRSLGAERQKVLNLFQKRFNIPTDLNPQPQISNKGFQGHLEIFRQPEVQPLQETVRSPQQQAIVPQQNFVPQQSFVPQQNFVVPQQNFAPPTSFNIWEEHPYISGYDHNIGAYSVNYGAV